MVLRTTAEREPGTVGSLVLDELLTDVEDAGVRLARLTLEAEDLDLAAAEMQEERRELTARAEELDAVAAEIESERVRLAGVADELAMQQRVVEALRQTLEHEARTLNEREAAFAVRWRWLLRAWAWRPRKPGATIDCEFLFVPTTEGYKLLEQEGVALRRGSRLTGLLGEDQVFVVTKIAPWSFRGRWCAYLQQEQQPTGREWFE